MPLMALSGNNPVEIDEALLPVRRRFNPVDIMTFDGATVPLATLSGACLTAGLFDPERLVIVQDLHQRMKGNRKEDPESEEIAGLLNSLAPTTTLVLVCADMPQDHQLASIVRAAGGSIEVHNLPRRGELDGWIMSRGRAHDVVVQRDAAELLSAVLGPNPILLESELEKLAVYSGEEKLVTAAMVDTLVGPVTQESVFALVDAIAGGNSALAFRLLRIQAERSSSGAIDTSLYLIRMLARQFRILLHMRLGRQEGRKMEEVAVELKIPRYYTGRYVSQASRLPAERIARTFEQLAALEFAIKNGDVEAAGALDLLVAELAA